jgi:hypothetical protein
LLRDTLSIIFGKTRLQLFHAFIVPLIPRFDGNGSCFLRQS